MSFSTFVTKLVEGKSFEDLNESHPLGHELDREADKHPEGFTGFVHSLGTWAKEHPDTILTVLHKLRPVLTIKQVSVVTSFDGVRDVLSKDHDFAVTYGPKMEMITDGAGFFLGMDDNTQGFTDRTNMQMLFRRDDIERLIKPSITALCQAQLDKQGDSFNLVEDYLKPIPALFAAEYFGLQPDKHQWLIKVTQTLFEYLFIDVVNDKDLAKEAKQAAAELRQQLDIEIANTSAGAGTVLGRGVKLHQAGVQGFDPVRLRNNVLGLLIGLVPTIAKSAAMAFDWATQDDTREAAFYQAYENRAAHPFQQYVRELTRLNPINPGLFRKAARDTFVISGGSAHPIKKDTLVFVSTYTAMRDARFVKQPEQLMYNRAASDYLTYGFGLHACFGRYISDFHVAQLLESLLDKAHYQRLQGEAGNLMFSGVFPSQLMVKAKNNAGEEL